MRRSRLRRFLGDRGVPARPEDVRFAVDAMLGSLARKLRASGFDSAYYRDGNDSGLLKLASAEKRVVVTADRQLSSSAKSRGLSAVLVKGDNDRDRIRSLVIEASKLGIAVEPGEPRCSLCSGLLTRVPRSEVIGLLPPTVAMRHRLFFRCASCGKVYWRGGHWKELRRLRSAFGDRTRHRRGL